VTDTTPSSHVSERNKYRRQKAGIILYLKGLRKYGLVVPWCHNPSTPTVIWSVYSRGVGGRNDVCGNKQCNWHHRYCHHWAGATIGTNLEGRGKLRG